MKRLIDVDDDALRRARDALGLPTIKATVNAALRLAAGGGRSGNEGTAVDEALDALASVEFDDRSAAWR